MRKTATRGGFSCQSTFDSFRQHLPFVFARSAVRQTDAGREMPKPK
jgi:hypothetical protein